MVYLSSFMVSEHRMSQELVFFWMRAGYNKNKGKRGVKLAVAIFGKIRYCAFFASI